MDVPFLSLYNYLLPQEKREEFKIEDPQIKDKTVWQKYIYAIKILYY